MPRGQGISPQVQFRAYGPALDLLRSLSDADAPLGGTAQELIDWLAWLLPRALKRVNLSEAEASLVIDALNGTLFAAGLRPPLADEIADAVELDGLDAKWQVDGPALVEKLRALDDVQTLAVILAARSFWRDPNAEGQLWRIGLARRIEDDAPNAVP